MQRIYLVARVRSLTRDFSNSIFRESDILMFINEALDRFKQIFVQFEAEPELSSNTSEPLYIPKQYHYLLAIYSASRCFSQDERHYQATTLMNEFEVKLEELKAKVDSGELIIVDPVTGEEVDGSANFTEYVIDNYFNKTGSSILADDIDEEV